MILRKFPFIQQYDSQDCGIACLRMIARFYNSSEEIILDNLDCVKKSYPNFWEVFLSLGGKIYEYLG